MMDVLKWAGDNYGNILMVAAALIAAAEIVVRMTPTEKDDGAVQRVGEVLKKIMDFLKVPNVKK